MVIFSVFPMLFPLCADGLGFRGLCWCHQRYLNRTMPVLGLPMVLAAACFYSPAANSL